MRNSFIKGLISGFKEKLAAQHQKIEATTALIWKGDPALDTFFTTRNPQVRSRSIRSTIYESAHNHGRSQGKDLQVRPGVKHKDRKNTLTPGKQPPRLLG